MKHYNVSDIVIACSLNGTVCCSVIDNNDTFIKQVYVMYTKKQALTHFKQYLREYYGKPH